MSSAKQVVMNMHEFRRDEKLAEILGISHDELNQTEWRFDEDKSEGSMPHLLVIFDKNSPKDILDKIIGLDDTLTVWLEPNELDFHEEFDEEELGGEG